MVFFAERAAGEITWTNRNDTNIAMTSINEQNGHVITRSTKEGLFRTRLEKAVSSYKKKHIILNYMEYGIFESYEFYKFLITLTTNID